ncbi:MAG: Peptidoglycan glycosyltransferase [Microgenomates group bacterium GW2011_GWC2_46_7]|nr:MAG: Peptidoglycan glycosyltransferase [Microgenomates group bacterium GW2011_GWC2_46_7]
MITAIAAIANDGVLMQPYVVKYTESSDGTKTEYEPEIIRQVVTKETADTMVAMLTAVIEQGIPTAVLDDHYVAGKSGTAQTYKWGKALTGPGTTITSFIGFGPIDDPQFIILTKLDYPKTSEWCTATAAPVGKEVLDFLYDYYNIPPDK